MIMWSRVFLKKSKHYVDCIQEGPGSATCRVTTVFFTLKVTFAKHQNIRYTVDKYSGRAVLMAGICDKAVYDAPSIKES